MYRTILCILVVALTAVSCQKEKPTPPAAEASAEGAAEAPAKPAEEAAKPAGPTKVDGAKAKELVSGGAVLLDVRTQGEFDGGHIDGAKLIPVQELSSRMDDVGAKDKPVVVYCASGMRSARAANMLAQAGYGEVYDLGAMGNW
jgi:rhodanese-related sulfurtransferase